jgi:hypothetical protein
VDNVLLSPDPLLHILNLKLRLIYLPKMKVVDTRLSLGITDRNFISEPPM